MRLLGRLGQLPRSTTVKRTPSNRTSPSKVLIQRYPSRDWRIIRTELLGRPDSVVQPSKPYSARTGRATSAKDDSAATPNTFREITTAACPKDSLSHNSKSWIVDAIVPTGLRGEARVGIADPRLDISKMQISNSRITRENAFGTLEVLPPYFRRPVVARMQAPSGLKPLRDLTTAEPRVYWVSPCGLATSVQPDARWRRPAACWGRANRAWCKCSCGGFPRWPD